MSIKVQMEEEKIREIPSHSGEQNLEESKEEPEIYTFEGTSLSIKDSQIAFQSIVPYIYIYIYI